MYRNIKRARVAPQAVAAVIANRGYSRRGGDLRRKAKAGKATT